MRATVCALLSLGMVGLCAPTFADDARSALPRIADIAIAPVNDAAIRAPLVVEKIKGGGVTPEDAWKKGLLDKDVLLLLLNQEGGDRGGLNLIDSSGLSLALTRLFVNHFPEQVAHPATLGAGARFRLAQYYFQTDDVRCVDLLEELVKEGRVSGRTQSPAWFFPMSATLLGEWYQSQGEVGKAIGAFSLLVQGNNTSAYADNASVDLARLYSSVGNTRQAQVFYARAKSSKSDWSKSMALSDQVGTLMAQERSQDAQLLLNEALAGAKPPRERIAVNALLANFHYRKGDFEKARRSAEAAVTESSNLKLEGNDLFQLFVAGAQECLSWIKRWQQTPLIVEPVKLEFPAESSEPRRQTLTVKTSGMKPFEIKSDDKRVRATLRVGSITERQFWIQREVAVEIQKGQVTPFESVVRFYLPDQKEEVASVTVRVTGVSSNSIAP